MLEDLKLSLDGVTSKYFDRFEELNSALEDVKNTISKERKKIICENMIGKCFKYTDQDEYYVKITGYRDESVFGSMIFPDNRILRSQFSIPRIIYQFTIISEDEFISKTKPIIDEILVNIGQLIRTAISSDTDIGSYLRKIAEI
jgi:hypothetical protein